MTGADRQRLAAILGMLGSDHAGERAAAGLQAEAFRRKHGLTWEKMINGKTVYVGGNPPWHTSRQPEPPTPPMPEPPMRAPPRPHQTPWNRTKWGSRIGLTTFGLVWIIIIVAAFWGTV